MYIVRWLIGHPLIALWVLGGVAILLTSSGVMKKHDSAEASQPEAFHVSIQADAKPEKVADHKIPATTGQKTLNTLNKRVAAAHEKTKSTTNGPHAKTDVAPVITKAENKVVPFANKAHTSHTPFDSQRATTRSVQSGDGAKPRVPVEDLSAFSKEDLLVMAREAYWNNGLDEASQIYAYLIKIEPGVLEHKGELGNVYWRQGYPKKAAELYSEIAIPMISNGNGERVANMVGFIGLFYPDKAAEINKKLHAKKGKIQ